MNFLIPRTCEYYLIWRKMWLRTQQLVAVYNCWECALIYVLVFYCHITNYHKFSGLQQHIFIISVSVGQESGHGWAVYSARLQSKCWPELGSYLEALQWTCYQALVVIDSDRIHFLVAVRLRAPASCWLFAGGHSQLLEAPTFTCHVSFSKDLLSTWQLTSPKPTREKESNFASETVLYNVMKLWEQHSIIFAIFYW